MKRQSLITAVLHTVVGIQSVLLPTAAVAEATQQQTLVVEVFRMRLDDWTRVPSTVRDDHRQLYEKCRAAVGRGKIERIDRIGGGVKAGARSGFASLTETDYATSFVSNGSMLMPNSIQTRNVGASMECEIGNDVTGVGRIVYENLPQPFLWRPMLDEGSASNIKRSEQPIFDCMRINASIPNAAFAGPSLLGVIPVPAGGEKATQLAVCFALGTRSGKPSATAAPDLLFEVLVLRGPPGAGMGDPAARIPSLLALPDSVETVLAVPLVVGRRATAESVTEWIFPTSASVNGAVLLPERLDQVNQESRLEIECTSVTAEACEVRLALGYDLRKPLLPAASRKGANLLSPETLTQYRLTVADRFTFIPGRWTHLKEVPLKPIIGTADGAAKEESCHVFARVQITDGS